ncbi:MAG: hypothetical protein RR426_09850 [Oscillospiraceae bacterium]
MNVRTQQRVDEVLARTKKRRQQRDRHLRGGLSALCLLLTVGLVQMFGMVTQGVSYGSPVTGAYATVLLHEGAGGYVLVGLLAFAAGTVITISCLWWHRNRDQK